MALWNQLQLLEGQYLEQIGQLYGDGFPMEIRQYLSLWIESHDWDSIRQDVSLATLRFHELLNQLDEHYAHVNLGNNLLAQHNLRRIKHNLQENFQEDPVQMAVIISHCLSEERKILESAAGDQDIGDPVAGNAMEQQNESEMKISRLKTEVEGIELSIHFLEDQQDEYDFNRNTLQSQKVDLNGQTTKEIQQEEQTLRTKFYELHIKRECVVKNITNALTSAEAIQLRLISEELPEWKRQQQMFCIGGSPKACLDQLQNWFTLVAKCLLQIRQQLKKVQELVEKFSYETDPLALGRSGLEEQVLMLYRSLMVKALVVERQPCMPTHPQRPLVIKTGAQFTLKIRCLVKLPELNFQLKVNVFLDKDLPDGEMMTRCRKFNIFGVPTKVMNLEESSGSLTAEFRHLQLKEKKANRPNESSLIISEELHLISFETKLIQPEICLDLLMTSLPIVVISHQSQLASAWASILWYNLLCCEPHNLRLFHNPPAVRWRQMSELISVQFSSVTERGLDEEQLRMLANKLLGQESQGDPEGLVSWKSFSKSEGRRVPVCQWIDAIIDLIKKHLLNIWKDGHIMGFVSREREKALLKDKPPGTFLLRFSETCRDGAITITWTELSQDGEVKVHSLKPYTKSDLSTIPLVDIIRDYTLTAPDRVPVNPLLYLYPDIPRDVAFAHYYSRSEEAMETGRAGQPYLHWHPIPVSDAPE